MVNVQTQSPFKFSRQVAVIAAFSAMALALPVAIIVWSLAPKKEVSEAAAPEELRQALESLVDSGLAPASLDAREIETRILAVHVLKTASALRELALEMGGTCLGPEDGSKEARLVISLSAPAYAEFFRRAALITGEAMPDPPQGGATPLVTIHLREATSP